MDAQQTPASQQTEELTVGQILELTPQRPAHGGALVARVGERVVFVRHGVVGETARARITGRGPKGRFFFADVVSVDQPSTQRQPHPWPQADALALERPLGGMEYGHLRLETQRDYKRQVLIDQLTRLGGLEADHLALGKLEVQALPQAEAEDLGWRTRSHFAVDPASGRIAMFAHTSSEPVAVQDFPLLDPRLQKLGLERLNLTGMTRLDVAVAASGQIALTFWVSSTTSPAQLGPQLQEQARRLWGDLEERQISLILAPERRGGRRRGAKPKTLFLGAAQPDLLETAQIEGKDFCWQVGASGFWQIHRWAPQTLGQALLRLAKIEPGERVYDLYAGAGFFTALAADAVGPAGQVLSLEGSPVTSANAAKNLGPGGISLTSASAQTPVRVERGDVASVLDKLLVEVESGAYLGPDLVICDPPREGAGRRVMEQVTALAPDRLAYVACDPAALGRDTGYLRELGWKLTALEAFDMYPHTHHLEALALFERA